LAKITKQKPQHLQQLAIITNKREHENYEKFFKSSMVKNLAVFPSGRLYYGYEE